MKHLFLLTTLIFLLIPTIALAQGQPLRVALLLEHKAKSTWNDQLILGLAKAKADFKLDTAIIVASDEDEQEAVFRAAAPKFDLVIIATHNFHEILRDNAANFRQTRFGVIDASIRGSNVTCITFADEQAAFLAGAAATIFAQKLPPKNDQPLAIGWLSGEDIPAMRSMFNGYQEGAKLIVPHTRVIWGDAHSFADQERAASEAKRLIAQGVQVMMLAAGAGNSAALAEAKKAGIYVLGLDVDQKNIYPGHVLLSIEKKIAQAVYQIISDTYQGNFQGKEIVTYDLKNGLAITDPAKSLGSGHNLDNLKRRLKELTHEINQENIRIKSLRTRTLCNCL